MASKNDIKSLTGAQAKIALTYLLERTYDTTCGSIWDQKIDEAINVARSYPDHLAGEPI